MKEVFLIGLTCFIISCSSSDMDKYSVKFKSNIPFNSQYIVAKLVRADNKDSNSLDSTKYYLSDYLKDSSYTNIFARDTSNRLGYVESNFSPYSFVEFKVETQDNFEIIFYPSVSDSIIIFNKILEPNNYVFRFENSLLNYGLYFIKIRNSSESNIFKRVYGVILK